MLSILQLPSSPPLSPCPALVLTLPQSHLLPPSPSPSPSFRLALTPSSNLPHPLLSLSVYILPSHTPHFPSRPLYPHLLPVLWPFPSSSPLLIPSFPCPSPDFLPFHCVQALINPQENIRSVGDFMSSGLLTRVKLGPGRSFGAPSRLPWPVIGRLCAGEGPQSAHRPTGGVIRTSTRGRLSVAKSDERIINVLGKEK